MARTSKYTPDVVKRITEAIQMGATYELAAAYGGIAYSTFNEWMHHKPAFSEAVKSAEGKAVMIWLAKIEKAASDGNWQAAAWKLERRYPDTYGRQVHKVDTQHSGEVTHRVVVRYEHDWRGKQSRADGDAAAAAAAASAFNAAHDAADGADDREGATDDA